MQKPQIRTGGANPVLDGEINLYHNPEAKVKSWYDTTRHVVFVNGMMNTGSDHATSARGLSLLQACPVIGIHNMRSALYSDGSDAWYIKYGKNAAGTLSDLGQCLVDKLTLLAAQEGKQANFDSYKAIVDKIYDEEKAKNSRLDRLEFVQDFVGSNEAAVSLYQYLVTLDTDARRQTKIYAHSQGNLITSNALTGVALALGADSIKAMEVNSFGSPTLNWPKGLDRQNYAFTFDPVSWLDYRFGFDSSKIGFLAAHGFETYMKYDAEFIVNRFRWGSFGLTASMDEKGLAEYCASLGANAPRLKPIFERLVKRHWTDCDDVALLYVRILQQPKHAGVLKKLALYDKSFIQLLIHCLTGGVMNFTSGKEKNTADYLKTLI